MTAPAVITLDIYVEGRDLQAVLWQVRAHAYAWALAQTGGNVKDAARLLGVKRDSIYKGRQRLRELAR